ncbi:MAG: TIGR03086 family protein [Mycobacterium sp.]|jgi:uncharacterized protein (TIGR03086 family)|nr:TIGR03086 family protein [Mycobacterium sp.]MBV8290942.1 TIGR03086 family protein [Mycobacterium sp.]
MKPDFRDFYAMDAGALNDLRFDVGSVTDAELQLPTPCGGWDVEDLIAHMDAEHEAILEPLTDALAPDPDVRTAFDKSATRWITAFGRHRSATVLVPKFGTELPVKSVLAAHFMDMLVHRLDLAHARGKIAHIADEWISVALGVARAIPADSPLRNPSSPAYSYSSPVSIVRDAPLLDQLVAALGRNPDERQHVSTST